MTIKERKKTNRSRLAFGVVVAATAAGFFLAGCGPGEAAATATPGRSAQVAAATAPPTVLSVLPTPAAASAVSPVDTPIPPAPTPDPEPEIEPPAAVPAIPTVAPDFTLQRSGGGTFTLSEQLSQGPVVLVFFQRGGG